MYTSNENTEIDDDSKALYSNNNFFPVKLSDQFKNISDDTVKKRAPKIRNKRTKDQPIIDILQLNIHIKSCFEQETTNLKEYENRIKQMLETFNESRFPYGIDKEISSDIKGLYTEYNITDKNSNNDSYFSYSEFMSFYSQLKKLIQKTDNITSNKLFQKYMDQTGHLIKEYKRLLSIPTKTSFINKNDDKDNVYNEKKKIIDEYLSIVSYFTNIDHLDISKSLFTDNSKTNWYCMNCESKEYTDGESNRICTNCGLDTPKTTDQTTYRDSERLTQHNRYRYEKVVHFKECIQQYQGKQNKIIDEYVYEEADKWFENHGLINNEGKTKKEKYGKITKEHLRLFMNESGTPKITKHYEDIHMMHYHITGKPCADISHLEEILYEDFNKLVDAFLSLKEVDRTNFLNGAFVLKKLLLVHKYPIKATDFPGLKTLSRREEHEDLIGKMFVIAGINDPNEFETNKKFM